MDPRASREYPVSRAHLVPETEFVGTVHSVFATACNLQVGDLLIVVHDAAKPHTPTSVRVAAGGAGLWSPATRTGDRVTHRAGVLSVGRHVLRLRQLPVWTPIPPRRSPHPWTLDRQATVLVTLAQTRRAGHPAEVDPRIADGLHTLRTQVTAAIRMGAGTGPPTSHAEHIDGIEQAVNRLIGFGEGLTPAGDDILVGFLAVLHRHRDTPGTTRALTGLRDAVGRHIHRTTDISAHYLRLAVHDHIGEALDKLLDAVDADAPATVLAARTAEMVDLGATSGADTVRGVLAGLAALPHLPHHPHLQETAA